MSPATDSTKDGPGGDPLGSFTAATRDWFRGAFAAPTPSQTGAWKAIAARAHSLVIAPTGSGKTLAAFLWALDRLISSEPDPEAPGGTRVLYISPLKALGVDVERNLRAPLIGITQTAKRLGLPAPLITVGVRSGDTTAADRRALLSHPPDILITTPESLFLMLTSKARETLSEVDTVIVDEVHAVAGTKRGAHLAVSLERLDALLPKPAQRIGLSATVEPRETGGPVPRRLGAGGNRGPAVAEELGPDASPSRWRTCRTCRARPGAFDSGPGLRAAAASLHLAACGGEDRGPGAGQPVHHRLRQLPPARRTADRPAQRDLRRTPAHGRRMLTRRGGSVPTPGAGRRADLGAVRAPSRRRRRRT